jgi:hypothetical protein
MPEGDGRERDHGRRQPPRRNELRSKTSPRQTCRDRCQEQPDIPQLDVDPFKTRNPQFAGIFPLNVFSRWKHQLKM